MPESAPPDRAARQLLPRTSGALSVSPPVRPLLAVLGLGLLGMGGYATALLFSPGFVNWRDATGWGVALLAGAFAAGALWAAAVTLGAALRGRSRVWGGLRLRDLGLLTLLLGASFVVFGRVGSWYDTLAAMGAPPATADALLWAGALAMVLAVRTAGALIQGRQRRARQDTDAKHAEGNAPEQGPAV